MRSSLSQIRPLFFPTKIQHIQSKAQHHHRKKKYGQYQALGCPNPRLAFQKQHFQIRSYHCKFRIRKFKRQISIAREKRSISPNEQSALQPQNFHGQNQHVQSNHWHVQVKTSACPIQKFAVQIKGHHFKIGKQPFPIRMSIPKKKPTFQTKAWHLQIEALAV